MPIRACRSALRAIAAAAVAVAVAVAAVTFGMAGVASANDTRTAVSTAASPDTTPDTLPEPNVFIPEDRDLSDCMSSLPKPGCGSEERGGAAQYITFAVLMLGMTFIGWRIFLGVRRRDRSQTPTT